MAVKAEVQKVVAAWEKDNPDHKGVIRFGSAGRTWEEQMGFILERPTQYKNISKRFQKQFSLKEMPGVEDLTDDQKAWFKKEIMKQAGKSPGFPHVGGKAVDLQKVAKLGTDGKESLKKYLEAKGYKVLLEKVQGKDTKYGVSISAANVFHVTK